MTPAQAGEVGHGDDIEKGVTQDSREDDFWSELFSFGEFIVV
jgi:hypothetical protein